MPSTFVILAIVMSGSGTLLNYKGFKTLTEQIQPVADADAITNLIRIQNHYHHKNIWVQISAAVVLILGLSLSYLTKTKKNEKGA